MCLQWDNPQGALDTITAMMKKTMKYLTRLALCIALLACSVFTARAFDRSFYAESSKLATGKWVKISVNESGIYQITADDIRGWGLGSDLYQIHVFGYGGAPLSEVMSAKYADDLPQMPVVRTANSILFYGQGPLTWTEKSSDFPYVQTQHPYALYGSYFVTNDSRFNDIEIDVAGNIATGEAVSTYTERLYHEQDIINPGETGRVFLGESFTSDKPQSFKFNLDGLIGGSTVNVYTVFCAKMTGAGCRITHSYNDTPISPSDTIVPVEDVTHEHYNIGKFTKSITLGNTNELDYKLNFHSRANVLLSRLDFITVNYERQLALRDGSLAFGLHKARRNVKYRISGCGSNTRVWDVTVPYHPVQLNTVSGGEGTIDFSPESDGRKEFVAFNETGTFLRPEYLGEVSNQDIHGMETPDMIIISPSAYLEQAYRVADLHEKVDKFRVLVLDHEKVFNEFSSGTRDAMAYRRVCKMFFDRGADAEGHKLGYLLLMGCGSYDNKLIGTNRDALNYPSLLTWQTEASNNENSTFIPTITTDDYFAILGDNSTKNYTEKMDIAVGRMPVKSVTEARNVVNKLIKYVTTPDYGSWKNQALIVADDGNQAKHMIQSDSLVNNARLYGGKDIVFNRVYIDAFNAVSQGGSDTYPDARAKMFSALKEGTLWWNYVGHASTQNWTAEGLMMRSDVETQLFYKHLPVLYAATCEYSRFDSSIQSSGIHVFLNPNGGAIAVICPARLAAIDENGYLTGAVGRIAFLPDETGRPRRIGDIFRIAKNNVVRSSENKRRFFVFGDPAMRLAYAPYEAKVETINGRPVGSNPRPVFKAREQVEFSGKIVDWKGELATNFNGTIVSTLFDAEQSVTTNGNGEGGQPHTFLDRANRLAINVDSVVDGRFKVRVIIPSEVNNEYDDFSSALINLYAYDSRDSIEAKGANSDFVIYGYEDEVVADTIGPEIITFTLNDDSFVDGADVNDSPLMMATVGDESGINFSSAGIGHSLSLTLDGTNTFNDLVSFYTPMFAEQGTLGNITYQLSDLTSGPHTLRLRVWDVYNNVSEKTISFNVVPGLAPEIADVYATSNPASVETSFYVKHNRPDAIVNVTIEVYDLMGRLVWKTTQSGRSDMYRSNQVTWDLTDRGGRRVPRGIYVYRATISTDGVKEATKAKKLAVTSEY